MYKDKNEIPIDIYDEVYINGDLYLVKGFIEYSFITEVVIEHKISHEVITYPLREVTKI